MEKKLRRKFILFTTSISVITLMLIAVLINAFNYASIISSSNTILDLLIENDLQLQSDFKAPTRLPQEFIFTTRYFVVTTNTEGTVRFIDTKNIGSINQESAIEYANSIWNSGADRGTIGTFRYAKLASETTSTMIFLDYEQELISFYSFRFYSIIISLAACILIFIASLLFSKKALSPIIESYSRQKRFITDVSHEFKTPLAIIKADNDVMELDYGKSEWSDSIKTQISRLNTLINNLITLTKLDEETAQIIKTDFSLSDALGEVSAEFSATIKNEDIKLNEDIAQNLSYNGDELSIRKLFALLIENAIKYAPTDSQVNLCLSQRGSRTVFTIENESDGVSIGRQDQWFERFYRAELSRNSSHKGYGIGLSIAKSICEQHKAKIYAESVDGKKVVMTVIF